MENRNSRKSNSRRPSSSNSSQRSSFKKSPSSGNYRKSDSGDARTSGTGFRKTGPSSGKPDFRKGGASSYGDKKPFKKTFGADSYKKPGDRSEGPRRPSGTGSNPDLRKSSSRYGDKKPFGSGDSSFKKRTNDRPDSRKPRFGDDKPDFRKGGSSYGDKKPFRKTFGAEDTGYKKFGDQSDARKPRFGGDKPDFAKKPRPYDADKPKSVRKTFSKDGQHTPEGSVGGESTYKPRTSRAFDDKGEASERNSNDKKKEIKSRFVAKAKDDQFAKDVRTPDYDKAASIKTKTKTKRSASEKADGIRLNRYIANSGVCSRRDADMLIAAGEITVNGNPVVEMGYIVQPNDIVKYSGRTLKREKTVYVLLNKPKDFITTTNDPDDRRTVMDLVAGAAKERLFPVGRLDRNTTGLLLLTNDGELAEKLSHPSNQIKKIYQVTLDRPLEDKDFDKIKSGVHLEDGVAEVDDIAIITGDRLNLGLEIHIGRNRIVRRIFEALGYEVEKLDRVLYAELTKKDLPRGNWRYLTEQEVIRLKNFQRKK